MNIIVRSNYWSGNESNAKILTPILGGCSGAMALGMQRLSLAILRRPGWRSCSSTPTEGLYDLVIASGGTVGAALACSIGKSMLWPYVHNVASAFAGC